MSHELTQQLLEQWEAAAHAANHQPSKTEAGETFAEIIKAQLAPKGN